VETSSSEDSAGASSEDSASGSEEAGASEEVAGAVEDASGAEEDASGAEEVSSSLQEANAQQVKIISSASKRESFFMFVFPFLFWMCRYYTTLFLILQVFLFKKATKKQETLKDLLLLMF
jgi:hypothetical protein